MKKLLNAVWPYLEGEPPIYNNFLDSDTEINSNSLDYSVDFARFMYESQKSRISTIESKSSIYLGFFGAVVAILSFALKDIVFLKQKELIHDVTLFFGGLLIIYILQVMLYSIKALERKGYYSLDENDFLHGDKRKTAVELINKVKKNYDVINAKVDCMTMAHEFTKRIVGVLFFIAISLTVLSVYKYVSLIPALAIDVFDSSLTLKWSDGLLFLVVIAIVINSVQLSRLKKKIDK